MLEDFRRVTVGLKESTFTNWIETPCTLRKVSFSSVYLENRYIFLL